MDQSCRDRIRRLLCRSPQRRSGGHHTAMRRSQADWTPRESGTPPDQTACAGRTSRWCCAACATTAPGPGPGSPPTSGSTRPPSPAWSPSWPSAAWSREGAVERGAVGRPGLAVELDGARRLRRRRRDQRPPRRHVRARPDRAPSSRERRLSLDTAAARRRTRCSTGSPTWSARTWTTWPTAAAARSPLTVGSRRAGRRRRGAVVTLAAPTSAGTTCPSPSLLRARLGDPGCSRGDRQRGQPRRPRRGRARRRPTPRRPGDLRRGRGRRRHRRRRPPAPRQPAATPASSAT